jgi:hypothetical protein
MNRKAAVPKEKGQSPQPTRKHKTLGIDGRFVFVNKYCVFSKMGVGGSRAGE